MYMYDSFQKIFYLSKLLTVFLSPDYKRPSSTVIIKDNKTSVLFDGRFPSTMPTIYLKRPVLTNQLNINFSSQIDIKEIEVFGGKFKGTSQLIVIFTTFPRYEFP